MNRLSLTLTILTVLAVAVAFSGCSSPEPLEVVITPTSAEPTATQTPIPVLAVASERPSTTPTATPASEETRTTSSPTPSQTPVAFTGPVVGQGYVSPTPQTPTQDFAEIPTVTPTPALPTDTPPPTDTPGPTATPVPGLDASIMGLQVYSNVDFDRWMQVIGAAQTTGVQWVKVQVNWAFLQPEGPQVFGERLQLFERQIEALNRAGFNVMLSIVKAPDWARSDATESGPPDDPQVYADFITFLLNDTKIGPVTDAIEVWNEPNLIREWRGTLPFDGAGYMSLFAPAYAAIRAYSPEIAVIVAGLAPTSSIGSDAIDDRIFLQQMYDAGLSNYGDVVIGAHPYGWGNPPDMRCCDAIAGRGWDDNPHFFFIENLEATYAIMQRNGHGDRQIWVTEFGWATWEGLPSAPPEDWMTYNSAMDQANYVIRAFEIGQELPYVGPMILWNLNFANPFTVENSDEVAGYSILNPVVFPSERPLYWMLGQATGAITP